MKNITEFSEKYLESIAYKVISDLFNQGEKEVFPFNINIVPNGEHFFYPVRHLTSIFNYLRENNAIKSFEIRLLKQDNGPDISASSIENIEILNIEYDRITEIIEKFDEISFQSQMDEMYQYDIPEYAHDKMMQSIQEKEYNDLICYDSDTTLEFDEIKYEMKRETLPFVLFQLFKERPGKDISFKQIENYYESHGKQCSKNIAKDIRNLRTSLRKKFDIDDDILLIRIKGETASLEPEYFHFFEKKV